MAIVRWEPARELASMEIDRLNRMFTDFYGEAFSRSAWVPAVDIYETDAHEVVLKAELPEMKREDISVTFENGVLRLRYSAKYAATLEHWQYDTFRARSDDVGGGSPLISFVIGANGVPSRLESGAVAFRRVAESR